MAGAAVQVEGLDNLVKTLRKAGADINELKDASKKAGDIVVSASAARAPRRTGRMAGNIRSSRLAKGVRVSVGGASLRYPPVIHWGYPARNLVGQPFMTDAAKATEPIWVAGYLADIQKIVDKVKGV
jgi:hypothetical protein